MKDLIWEPMPYPEFKPIVEKEIFIDKIYTKLFSVSPGDIVFDIGASIGPFTYSILDKRPKHVFAFEPSYDMFKTLVLNTRKGPVTHINKGFAATEGEFNFEFAFSDDGGRKMYSTTFKKVIEDYNIKQIDFLKTDCEGGEYDIFTPENLIWIKKNIRKIVGEWHLRIPEHKEKFRAFRDLYLRMFPNHEIYSCVGENIKGGLWSDKFIEHYKEVTIYIYNPKELQLYS